MWEGWFVAQPQPEHSIIYLNHLLPAGVVDKWAPKQPAKYGIPGEEGSMLGEP